MATPISLAMAKPPSPRVSHVRKAMAIALPQDEEMAGPFERLSGLELGQSAKVVSISPFLRPHERRRMLDLGLIPGTEIQAEIRSPAGDPTGYRIRGAVIALRREQAEHVYIHRASQGEA